MRQVQITRYMDEIKEEVSEYDNWTNEEKKTYIGGAFDSEGCAMLRYAKNGYYSNIIQIMTSVDYDHITIVKKFLESQGYYINIYSYNNKYNCMAKTAHTLVIASRKYIKKFINDFKDFVILKRKQLDTLEGVLNGKLSKPDGYKIIKYLNERGRNASNTNRIIKRNSLYLARPDLAKIYISALIDTEGYINVENKKSRNKMYRTARVCFVCSTNLSYVKLVKEIINKFGVDLYLSFDSHLRNPSAKPSYSLVIRKKSVILEFPSIFGKYLILKKLRLQCIINISNDIDVEENVKRLKKLNKRGAN